MVLTSRWPPLSTTAYTLPATRLLTNSVPLSPQVITRALLIPCAQSEALKPGGSLILSTGISPGALGAGGWAMGASAESAMLGGWPCFQVGGGACWAPASGASARPTTSAAVSDVRMMRRMMSLPCEDGEDRVDNGPLVAHSTTRPGPYVATSRFVKASRWVARTRERVFAPRSAGVPGTRGRRSTASWNSEGSSSRRAPLPGGDEQCRQVAEVLERVESADDVRDPSRAWLAQERRGQRHELRHHVVGGHRIGRVATDHGGRPGQHSPVPEG